MSGFLAGGFIIGRSYMISSVGTTNFTLIGASASTVGVVFTATGLGTGSGTATLVGDLVLAGSFIRNQPYTIQTLGTTDFTAIGASANTVGVTFTATGVGTGTGIAASEPTYVKATSVVSGHTYIVTTLGTTDFTLIGASSNTVGVRFTATGAGVGTGTVYPVFIEPSNAVDYTAGTFIVGQTYVIKSLGTTVFTACGASANQVGIRFKATNAGLGTGVASVEPIVDLVSPIAIAAGLTTNASVYEIATVGTTDFTLIGASSNTVGVRFTATGAGVGTGTVYPVRTTASSVNVGIRVGVANIYAASNPIIRFTGSSVITKTGTVSNVKTPILPSMSYTAATKYTGVTVNCATGTTYVKSNTTIVATADAATSTFDYFWS